MTCRLLLFLSFFTCVGLRFSAAQTGIDLPDPTGSVPYISPRTPQPPTRIPDPASRANVPADPMQWWREARFGMFIHWGIYAVPAGEWNGKTDYGEWIRSSAKIPLEVYDRFRTDFNPEKFDADSWVKMARDAGMKYIVITSKHHDGFCMFDTKQTDFNIMSTPFRRDPMKELAAACRKYGLRFCFYYSIMDWHHPDYIPRRNWETGRDTSGAEYDRYMSYMKAQLKELLTNYGDIGVLWFDGEWETTWNEKHGKEIYYFVKGLQPGVVVNNRVGAGRLDMEGLTRAGSFGGDFCTPEQQIPSTGLPGVDWETCMTMNDHWGYNRADKKFKTVDEIIRMLVDIASKGGNYLLNVGPTAEGLFPGESVERLAAVGKWMKVNGESVYGTQASPFKELSWGRCTRKQTSTCVTLYLHVFERPADGKITLHGVLNAPVEAYLLADPKKKPLKLKRKNDMLIIQVPATVTRSASTVIALELRGKLDLTEPPEFMTEFDTFVDSMNVNLSSPRENVEIRYVTGNSDISVASSLYTGPIRIKSTTCITAMCFRAGKPVSRKCTKVFKKVEPQLARIPGASMAQEPGLRYRYFEGAWDSLPDFHTLVPVKSGVVDDFVFTQRNREEMFAFEYEGYVRIPEAGVYMFSTSSDDGSRLWINDQPVVNNDGLHGMAEKSGKLALDKGFHHIRVGYFERTGSNNLSVFIKSQTMTKQMLPREWLFH